jgi:hypothetical protein
VAAVAWLAMRAAADVADGVADALSLAAGPHRARQARTTGSALLLAGAELLLWLISGNQAGTSRAIAPGKSGHR